MTTEDDFQRLLDAHPEDWHTRLVFADWLEDRDDPRAEGYRALGVQRKRPAKFKKGDWVWHVVKWKGKAFSALPNDWSNKLTGGNCEVVWPPSIGNEIVRKQAEDAAALAFAKLSKERKQELLSTAVGVA